MRCPLLEYPVSTLRHPRKLLQCPGVQFNPEALRRHPALALWATCANDWIGQAGASCKMRNVSRRAPAVQI